MHKAYWWGSHPNEGKDNCDRGGAFASLADAESFLAKAPSYIQHLQLIHPDGTESVRVNPDYSPQPDTPDNDGAIMAGMAFGCAGYNDYTGQSLEDPDEP